MSFQNKEPIHISLSIVKTCNITEQIIPKSLERQSDLKALCWKQACACLLVWSYIHDTNSRLPRTQTLFCTRIIAVSSRLNTTMLISIRPNNWRNRSAFTNGYIGSICYICHTLITKCLTNRITRSPHTLNFYRSTDWRILHSAHRNRFTGMSSTQQESNKKQYKSIYNKSHNNWVKKIVYPNIMTCIGKKRDKKVL